LKSLRAPNHDFAELFIFNGLTAFSLRAISHTPFLNPKGPIDILACARERRHPAPFARPRFPVARECAGRAISCDRVILRGGRFGHGCLGYDGDLAIIIEDSEIGNLFLFFVL
jgi:hypothetical protein